MVLSTDQIKKENDDDVSVDPNLKLKQTGNKQNENLDTVMETDTNTAETEEVKHIRTEKDIVRNLKCYSEKHRRNSHDRHSCSLEREKDKTEARNDREDNSEACRKLTNFSIDRILRSDFGPKPCGRYDNGVRSFPPTSLSSSPFSSSSLFSPVGVSSRLSSKVLSAFSSAPTSAFAPKQSPSPLVKDRHCSPRRLTSPSSSPESSSSSFSSLSASSSRHLVSSSLQSKKETPSPPSVGVTSAGKPSDRKDSDSSPVSSAGQQLPWPAWVYCTRYSDRPSSGEFVLSSWLSWKVVVVFLWCGDGVFAAGV